MTMTLLEMLERGVKIFPEKTALIYQKFSLTYKMLYEKSTTLANFLIHIGLKKGQRVGLLLHKTPEAIISFLGVTSAGGIVFPIADNQIFTHIPFNFSFFSMILRCFPLIQWRFFPIQQKREKLSSLFTSRHFFQCFKLILIKLKRLDNENQILWI